MLQNGHKKQSEKCIRAEVKTLREDDNGFQSYAPEKKSDPIEQVSGKTGAVFGELINILTTLKGLRLGYDRDLQETKPPAIQVSKEKRLFWQ